MSWQRFTRDVTLHGVAQMCNLLAINQLDLRECCGCVAVLGWGDETG